MAASSVQCHAWFISLLLFCSSVHGILPNPITSSSGSNVRFAEMFNSIYQFGDGFSDTGNMHIIDPKYGSRCSNAPYGETLFIGPTGRCSDGLLMIDYFAEAFGLPLLEPYMGINNTDFSHGVNFGVNFAVDGAFATNVWTNPTFRHTLPSQLEWFRNYLNLVCSSPSECKNKLEKSLFLVGGIGTNDYRLTLDDKDGPTMQDAHNLVPQVVQTVINAVKEVIEEGAVNVVVPGLLPLGCMPLYQKEYGTAPVYDNLGCQTPQNELARIHNEHLQQALKQLRKQYPKAVIHYGDYYRAFTWLLQNAASLGFEKDANFKQCCGWPTPCGISDAPLCLDPKKRISWDGVHLTQEAYRYMADWLLSDLFSHTASRTPSTSPSPSPSHHSGASMISAVLLQALLGSILTFWTIGLRWL